MPVGFGEEIMGTAERMRNRAGACRHRAIGIELFGRDDEAASDGVEDLLADEMAGGIEGGETQTIGMSRETGWWIHLVAMEEQMFGLTERNGLGAIQGELVATADGGEQTLDRCGVDGVRGLPG